MTMKPFVVTPEQRAPALGVLGTEVTILASDAVTGGYGLTFQQGDEGTGPPPHSHDWDESFYVLAGVVEFVCDGERHVCTEGTLVHVPRNTVHGFRYGKGGGRMLEVTGEDTRAAQMFTDVAAVSRSDPPDIPKVLEALQRNGVSVPT